MFLSPENYTPQENLIRDEQCPRLQNLKEGRELSKKDIISLLNVSGQEQEKLFATVREKRKESFTNKANIRGVIEVSNYCGSSCQYCSMRVQNTSSRYRLSSEHIFKTALQVKEAGIKEVFLQSGEDKRIIKALLKVIPEIKEKLGLQIILSLGEWDTTVYKKLKEAGADGYILKHETSDPNIFQKMKPHTSMEKRLFCLKELKRLGFNIGTGTLIGLPEQDDESVTKDLLLAKELNVDMISIAPLIISKNTPLANFQPDERRFNKSLNYIALSRILLPKAIIPAISALEKVKKDLYGQAGGQIDGFRAGANNITVNFTPPAERKKYTIYSDQRFVVKLKHALNTIKKAGLESNL